MPVGVAAVVVVAAGGCSKVVVMVVERHSAGPDRPLMGGRNDAVKPPLECVCFSSLTSI